MWKKPDDGEGAQSQSASDATRLLEEALTPSLSINDDLQKRNSPVSSEKVVAEGSDQPMTSPTMNTYTDAVKEFTANATAFIEHLPLLAKARAAYEEAMRASTEMRKVLDASDQNLRTLMTQLEQQVNLRELKAGTDKKPPEPAKIENFKGFGVDGSRAFKWP